MGADKSLNTLTIKSEDCFKEYGFSAFVAGCDAEYKVEMKPAGTDVKWEVYVLDDKFTDALRYIPQAYEPSLTESGTISVKQHQYVYVYCSVNTYTSDTPAVGAVITFTGNGVPKA